MIVTKPLLQWLVKHKYCAPVASDADDETIGNVAKQGVCRALLNNAFDELDDTQLEEFAEGERLSEIDFDNEKQEGEPMPTTKDVYGKDGSNVRVKRPSEMYSDKSYTGKHSKTGQPILDEHGQEVQPPSQRNYAMNGALIKHLMWKGGLQCAKPTEHERSLLDELATEHEWAGDLNGEYCKSIKPAGTDHIKALLDDSTSGGIEVAPIHFDDDIVSTPQLHGELWPHVGKQEVARGRRVEGGQLANISVTSGEGNDNQEMDLFNTASLIAALNTTIFPVGVAVELGRDFMADAAVDVGALVTREIGNSMMAWLDEQVAIGDGTTEPEGVMNASGTTAIAWNTTTTVGNLESTLFGVPKAQRPKGSNAVRWCATETSYRRARGIPVGTADSRRVLGLDEENFQVLGRPYSISTAMANSQLFFGDLARGYRAYRRKGMSIETHTNGSYLARRNLALVVARMRVGGRVVLPSSFAVATDLPA